MLRIIGAGLPRTATSSLHEALPKLLGGKCYHMTEVFKKPTDAAIWLEALRGAEPQWSKLLDGCAAAVDWPAAAFWPQLAREFPDAIILLSRRSDARAWYRSMSDTILRNRQLGVEEAEGMPDSFSAMFDELWRRFSDADPDDAAACQAAYDDYLRQVRDTAPAGRLVEWEASQGWEPICRALDVPIPDEPFPHRNSTQEFQRMVDSHLA